MRDRARRSVLACSAAAAAAGAAVGGAILLGSPAVGAPAPTTTPGVSVSSSAASNTGGPIQIILPASTAPSATIGPKDVLIPVASLIGAALGFGSAILGARLAANAQDRRSRLEAQLKQQEETRTRALVRLETLTAEANSLIGDAAKLANSTSGGWNMSTAERDGLRLRAAQLLGARHLLDKDLDGSVREFVGAVLEIADAPTAAQAQRSVQRCGATFEELMRAAGEKFRSRTAPANSVDVVIPK